MENRRAVRYMEGETEKRRATRYKKRLKVMFGPHETINFGFLEDISKTGIKIKTSNVYAPGTELKLNIHNDKSDTIMLAEGYVAWAKKAPDTMIPNEKSGMGVRLVKIDPILKRFYEELRSVRET